MLRFILGGKSYLRTSLDFKGKTNILNDKFSSKDSASFSISFGGLLHFEEAYCQYFLIDLDQ
mgnify:CR=1 FL=1